MTNTPQSLVEILKFLCLFGSSVSKKNFPAQPEDTHNILGLVRLEKQLNQSQLVIFHQLKLNLMWRRGAERSRFLSLGLRRHFSSLTLELGQGGIAAVSSRRWSAGRGRISHQTKHDQLGISLHLCR